MDPKNTGVVVHLDGRGFQAGARCGARLSEREGGQPREVGGAKRCRGALTFPLFRVRNTRLDVKMGKKCGLGSLNLPKGMSHTKTRE